jgi:hypothetical protein
MEVSAVGPTDKRVEALNNQRGQQRRINACDERHARQGRIRHALRNDHEAHAQASKGFALQKLTGGLGPVEKRKPVLCGMHLPIVMDAFPISAQGFAQ